MMRNERHWGDIVPTFNRSYTYIFPMLGRVKDQFLNVKACFIGDEEKPEFNQHIFLLHNFSGCIQYAKYEKSLSRHPEFVEQYSPDNETDMFVFTVPELTIEDYEKILKSKYSRVSNRFKNQIIRFHSPYTEKIENQIFFKVLFRNTDLRRKLENDFNVKLSSEDEVSSLMNFDIEIFREWMKVPNIT